MLGAMRHGDPRFNAIALPAGSPAVDATVRCVVMLWPVINPWGRYQMAKREAAKKAGAFLTIDPAAADASKQIIDATSGGGAWAVIDLVGASRTAQLGLESMRKGGKLILDGAFGIPDETPSPNVRAMFDAARKYAG